MTDVAEVLAPTAGQEVADSQRDLFLTFHLHNEDYGIAISYVSEIIGIQKITEVPDMPEYIKGVINLRGRVVPVMDVRLRFGMPVRDYDERTCVIVVDVAGWTIGLLVDRVKEVAAIPADQIEPPPRQGGLHGYIQGMGKIEKEVKMLLHMENLFGDEVLKEREEQLAG